MKLYIFRHSEEIPIKILTDICQQIVRIMGIQTVIINESIGQADLNGLAPLSTFSDKNGDPFVALVFTIHSPHEGVLGEGIQRNRCALSPYFEDKNRTLQLSLHELGHIFEASHCNIKSCLMFPYYAPLELADRNLCDITCPTCYQ